MIIRSRGPSLVLITQPDHASLAARLMTAWTSDGWPDHPRRASIMHAIEQHDNGWAALDVAPIVEPGTGRLLDFISAPAEVRQGVWPRGAAHLSADPYAAALVAQHAVSVYGRFRDREDWRSFFTQMEHVRDDYRLRTGVALDVLQRDYFFLRIADLMSLVFCHEDMGPQHLGAYDIRLDGDVLVVSPDPFGGIEVPFEIRARELPRQPYGTPAAASDAFDASRPIALRGVARGAPISGRAG